MMGRMKPTSLTQKPCVAVLHYGGGSGVVLLHDSNVVVPHQNSNPVLELHPELHPELQPELHPELRPKLHPEFHSELQFKNFSSRAIIFKFLILIFKSTEQICHFY